MADFIDPTVSVLLVFALAACGGDDVSSDASVPTDAGPDAMMGVGLLPSGATLAMPAAPEPPAPVDMTCAAGWRRVPAPQDGWAEICAPWPESGPLDCAPGEIQVPGTATCAPLGADCPADGFPAPTSAPTIYVDADAAAAGDGSRASPLTTIAEAISVASAGSVIALAAGTHETEPAVVPAGVTLSGSCAAQSRVEVTDRSGPALELEGGASLTDLAVSAAGTAIEVTGADVTVTGVEVRSASTGGIIVREGGTLTAERVSVRLRDKGAESGIGIQVDGGGAATFSATLIEGARQYAVLATGAAATLRMTDVVIRETQRLGLGYGTAIQATQGANVVVARGALERNVTSVFMSDADTRVELDQVLVADGRTDGEVAPGVVLEGGELTMRDSAIHRVVGVGLQCQGSGAMRLSDVVVRDTQVIPVGVNAGNLGTGINIYLDEAARSPLDLEASRVSIEASRNAAIIVQGMMASATFADLTVLDAESAPDDLFSGEGILVLDGAHGTVDRARFERIERVALHADWGGELALSDVLVRDVTGVRFDGSRGFGLHALRGSSVTGERLSFERTRQAAVLINSEAIVALADLTISDVRSAPDSSTYDGFGVGVWVATEADAAMERVRVTGARGAGILCLTAGTRCRFTDIEVTQTQSWERDDLLTRTTMLGHGLEIQRADAEVSRAVLTNNRGTGLQVIGGSVDLEDILVQGTREDEAEGIGGYGLTGTAAAQIVGRFIDIVDNGGLGVGAYSEGTVVDLTDVRISDTRENPCAAETCIDNPGGVGALATGGAALSLRRLEIARSALAGLMLSEGAQADLTTGAIHGNPIGANVQVPGYDIARLQNDVEYIDNETNLDATSLPVPAPPGLSELPDMPDEP